VKLSDDEMARLEELYKPHPVLGLRPAFRQAPRQRAKA
jgi:hypothetical protein